MSIHLDLEKLYTEDKRDRKLFDEDKLSQEELRHNNTRRLNSLRTILPTLDTTEIWNPIQYEDSQDITI